jgi:hypothetical protein
VKGEIKMSRERKVKKDICMEKKENERENEEKERKRNSKKKYEEG